MAKSWLFKTEPSSFSYGDLEKEGGTVWDGIKNPTALIYLRQVKKGDRVLLYHTGGEKAVAGIARVTRGARPDPRASDPRLVVVDIAPVRRLAAPVALAAIKADPRFRGFELLRLPRLSVMPVPAPMWDLLVATGKG